MALHYLELLLVEHVDVRALQIEGLCARVFEDSFLGDVLCWVALDALDVTDPKLLVPILIKNTVPRLVLEIPIRHRYRLGDPWRIKARLGRCFPGRIILIRRMRTVIP